MEPYGPKKGKKIMCDCSKDSELDTFEKLQLYTLGIHCEAQQSEYSPCLCSQEKPNPGEKTWSHLETQQTSLQLCKSFSRNRSDTSNTHNL